MSDHTRGSRSHKADLHDVAKRAMIERGLEPDFSELVEKEVVTLKKHGAAHESLRDLTALPWLSIDNDDSQDLDQLSVAEALANGATKISVAIADVDALVARGSAIDEHARKNTTSVYTAAQIFPMLPFPLSTDLTSLGEKQVRAAIVIECVVQADGTMGESDVFRANVKNHAKLAYNGVAAWLDDKAPAPARVTEVPGIDAQLRLQDRVAQNLRRRRFEKGALTLETLEARPVFTDGTIADLVAEGRNRAKDLIEDLMIAANGVTARFLETKKSPSLRRVLRSPERWEKIRDLAASRGRELPPTPSNAALEEMLNQEHVAAPSRFADLSLAVVKLLGRGEYVVETPGNPVPGHFGLALRDYTHSTAPNRRFPDLITHRLLKAVLDAKHATYTRSELEALAAHCTQQEDAAAKVERRVRKSAAALLLSHRIGQRFEAIVTGVSPKGTYVRIDHPAAEGRLTHGTHGLDVGDRVRVELVRTDFEKGHVDFSRT